jgi:hypothetical protein
MQKSIPDDEITRLGHIYSDFDKAFNRTKSRAAIDGGVLLLAIIDELRMLRETLQSGKVSTKGVGSK